ncbi:MAG: transcription termination/antitermination protein NusA [Candidatus Eisenbacteria sp.]|nr:transcription termination/antitermination protein NusA [Candidatus Eisenbacteria bacterium]
MTSEIIEALTIIAKEKGVDPEYLLETLEAGLLTAAQKKYRRAAHVEVEVDQASGEIAITVHMRVTRLAWDSTCEIDLEEARKIESDVREGDVVPVEVPVAEFGRNAISAVKQSLVQHVREAERKNVYEEYVRRVGQILTGTVQQVDRGSIILRLGGAEGIIPPEENIRRDRPKIGDHLRALLINVDSNARGPQVIFSRTRPEFVLKLFEQEVPEVYEGIVEIKGIARDAGARTKVAVVSHDDRVDPVGACVGVKGSRVQNIVKALGGERIDIVALSSDPLILVSRSLSPARVLSVSFMGDPKTVRAVVPDDQLSLAIGKNAQNVRLAGQLCDLEIQLVSQSQQASLEGGPEGEQLELESLTKELGPKLVERLIRAGKETLQDVLESPVEELMAIPGIGEKTASKLVTVGAMLLDKWNADRQQPEEPEESDQAEESEKSEESEESEQPQESEEPDQPEASGEPSVAEGLESPPPAGDVAEDVDEPAVALSDAAGEPAVDELAGESTPEETVEDAPVPVPDAEIAAGDADVSEESETAEKIEAPERE